MSLSAFLKYCGSFLRKLLEDIIFLICFTQLFLIYFKVNIRALSGVSWSSSNSKGKSTVIQAIISFDYHNFSIFLKIWIRQKHIPNSSFLTALFIFSYFSQVPNPLLSARSCEITLSLPHVQNTKKVQLWSNVWSFKMSLGFPPTAWGIGPPK